MIDIALIGMEMTFGVWVDAGSVVQGFGLCLGRTINLFFSLISCSVLLRFLTLRELNGWLDAPLQGLLGFFLFSVEILFIGLTIYLIPSVQQALGGTVPMLRTPKPPFHYLVPPGLYLSQPHKHIHKLLHTYT